jgi:hypothetical protein
VKYQGKMPLNHELHIVSRIHEDCSGVVPPPRNILFVDEYEVVEYVRESYHYAPYFYDLSDQDLILNLMSANGVKIPLSKVHWDELRLSLREMN